MSPLTKPAKTKPKVARAIAEGSKTRAKLRFYPETHIAPFSPRVKSLASSDTSHLLIIKDVLSIEFNSKAALFLRQRVGAQITNGGYGE